MNILRKRLRAEGRAELERGGEAPRARHTRDFAGCSTPRQLHPIHCQYPTKRHHSGHTYTAVSMYGGQRHTLIDQHATETEAPKACTQRTALQHTYCPPTRPHHALRATPRTNSQIRCEVGAGPDHLIH